MSELLHAVERGFRPRTSEYKRHFSPSTAVANALTIWPWSICQKRSAPADWCGPLLKRIEWFAEGTVIQKSKWGCSQNCWMQYSMTDTASCKSVILKCTADRLSLAGPPHYWVSGGTMLLPTLKSHENNSQQSSLYSRRTGMLMEPSTWYFYRPCIHTSDQTTLPGRGA